MKPSSFPSPSSRPDWDEYFLDLAGYVSHRSTCLRRQVGAILVKDHRLLTTGYNGTPRGLTHCRKTGCLREAAGIPSGERFELCRGIHAEMNAILQAAIHGVVAPGSTLYSTHYPCVQCAKVLLNIPIARLVAAEDYPHPEAKELFRIAGIPVSILDPRKEPLP